MSNDNESNQNFTQALVDGFVEIYNLRQEIENLKDQHMLKLISLEKDELYSKKVELENALRNESRIVEAYCAGEKAKPRAHIRDLVNRALGFPEGPSRARNRKEKEIAEPSFNPVKVKAKKVPWQDDFYPVNPENDPDSEKFKLLN